MINRTGDQLLPAYREIAGQLPYQDYLHGDETGWKVRGENQNLWTACNQDLACFHMDLSRGSDVPKRLDQLAQMKLPGKAANLAKRIAKHRDNLLRFVHHPGLDYHNNRAERQLRPSVIARKISFGSDTDHGARRHCIINSVIQTCRLQNHSPIDYLKQAINAPPGIPPSLFSTH